MHTSGPYQARVGNENLIRQTAGPPNSFIFYPLLLAYY
jgi:hypothetical protein